MSYVIPSLTDCDHPHAVTLCPAGQLQLKFSCLRKAVVWIKSSCIVYWIEVNLKNLKTILINRTRLRTKGHSAGYPQAKIEIRHLLPCGTQSGPIQICWTALIAGGNNVSCGPGGNQIRCKRARRTRIDDAVWFVHLSCALRLQLDSPQKPPNSVEKIVGETAFPRSSLPFFFNAPGGHH